jgi:hypothetical protein
VPIHRYPKLLAAGNPDTEQDETSGLKERLLIDSAYGSGSGADHTFRASG